MSKEDVVEKRLNQITRLLALIVTKEDATKKEKVLKLASLGFDSADIAEILNMETPRVSEIRSKNKPKEAKENDE